MRDLFVEERLLGQNPYITETAYYDVLDLMFASYKIRQENLPI
jgi:hypothetical protein